VFGTGLFFFTEKSHGIKGGNPTYEVAQHLRPIPWHTQRCKEKKGVLFLPEQKQTFDKESKKIRLFLERECSGFLINSIRFLFLSDTGFKPSPRGRSLLELDSSIPHPSTPPPQNSSVCLAFPSLLVFFSI
jgi:hypothetical protein